MGSVCRSVDRFAAGHSVRLCGDGAARMCPLLCSALRCAVLCIALLQPNPIQPNPYHLRARSQVGPACLKGDKVICLGTAHLLFFSSECFGCGVLGLTLACDVLLCAAITEPDAGSDVANLKTTAVKSADGSHYIVNG